MAILFMDGFDHYAAGDILGKYTVGVPSFGVLSIGTGRFGGSNITLRNSDGGQARLQYFQKTLASTVTTILAGFAFNPSSGPGIISFQDAANITHLQLRWNGTFLVAEKSGTTFGTGTIIMQGSVWSYVEVKLVVHASTGSILTKINGITDLNLSSQNTVGTSGTASVQNVTLGSILTTVGAGATIGSWDDLVVYDTSTGVGSDGNLIGERRVYTIQPTAAGTYAQFTQVGGTTNQPWTAVNNTTPDGDTSYLSSATVAQLETSTFADLPSTAQTVTAVQFNHWARKDDAGTRTIAPYQKNGGSEAAGTTSAGLASSYVDTRTIQEVSLLTSTAWTVSEINASEFGTKIIA
jgi:hypothetical protein